MAVDVDTEQVVRVSWAACLQEGFVIEVEAESDEAVVISLTGERSGDDCSFSEEVTLDQPLSTRTIDLEGELGGSYSNCELGDDRADQFESDDVVFMRLCRR